MPWWKDGKVCAPLDIATNLYEPWGRADLPVNVHNHNSTDTTEHYLLYRDFIQKSLREEGRVGWNPLKGGGTAEYANTMATPGDFTYVFHLFMPYWHAWNLGLMLQYMVAMAGMFAFLRYQKYERWLCVAGAIAYGLNSHFAGWVFHRWALGGFCWTPWYLLGFMGLRDNKRFGLLTPLFLAASFFGGQIQYAVFQIFVCVAFWIGWQIGECRKTNRFTMKPLLTMLTPGVIATLLACVMFIPCIYAFHVTVQSGLVRGGLGYPDGILSVVKGVAAYPTYIFPALYGSPGTFDMGRFLSTAIFHIPFFGSVMLVLAFSGLFVKSGNMSAKVIALSGLLLPLTPLVGPMYQRLIMIFILGGIWLAIDMISNCPEGAYKRIARIAKIAFALVFAGVLLIGIAAAVKHDLLAGQFKKFVVPAIPSHRFGARPDWFLARVDKFISNLSIANPRIWLSLLAFGVSAWMLPSRHKKYFGLVLSLCLLSQL